jgi:hypothetical protein
MSDIDEIALETVKAIGNIDPDKLPGGRTQATAQAQILVRDAIGKQLKQARARVAELEDALVWSLGKLSIEVPVSGGNVSYIRAFEKAGAVLGRASSESWLLRKQAEAVEKFGQEIGVFDPEYDDQEYVEVPRREVKRYAQRLRQQADEIEKAGGEK